MLATFGYDDLGRRISLTYGNGTSTSYSYDPVSRLTALTNDLADTSNDLTIGSMSYNPASQIVTNWRSNDAYAWTGHFNQNYGSTADGLNRILNFGPKSITHDTRGNITAIGTRGFTYSSENLLLTGPSSTTLSYDPVMRLHQIVSGATTKFAYDGLDRIAEYDGSSSLQRRYVHGPGMDEALVWYEGTGTSDRRFLEADERGSVILVTDGSGATLTTNRYDDFGQPQSTNLGTFGYTGQAWLNGIGVWYYKARVLDSEVGRFLQTDPIGYWDGPNLYAYVLNDPVNLTDPLGLKCWWVEGSGDAPICDTNLSWVLEQIGPGSGPGSAPGADRPYENLLHQAGVLVPTLCPPVNTKVTGVGPNQANTANPSSISQIPGNQLPNGAVAIDPLDFGQSRVTNENRSALQGITIIPLWETAERPTNGAPAIPRGLPSAGPYSVHDVIGPRSARNQPGFHIDLYRYSDQANALASTRQVQTVSVLPPNDVGLQCPSGN